MTAKNQENIVDKTKLRKAVFLDRDGVLNHDPGHVFRVDDLRVLSGVSSALRRLQDAGFLLLVITNQGGIARGKFTLSDTEKFNTALAEQIHIQSGAKIAGFFVCPHHPEGTIAELAVPCRCRKPGTLLIEQAQILHSIDLAGSFFIGDRGSDVECGIKAGMTAIQVAGERSFEKHPGAAVWLADLTEAAAWILTRP